MMQNLFQNQFAKNINLKNSCQRFYENPDDVMKLSRRITAVNSLKTPVITMKANELATKIIRSFRIE